MALLIIIEPKQYEIPKTLILKTNFKNRNLLEKSCISLIKNRLYPHLHKYDN